MYYSDEIIEEVRSRNDIVDVISTYPAADTTGCPLSSIIRSVSVIIMISTSLRCTADTHRTAYQPPRSHSEPPATPSG